MATNSIITRSTGQIIEATDINQYSTALGEDFVGRNSSGVPTANKNLGTATFPWGTGRFSNLVIGGTALDTSQISAPAFRVISGRTRSATNSQPQFIDANGAADEFTVQGATTNLGFVIGGSSFTLAADLTETSLSLAPASNNTALLNDVDAVDQEHTRTWGEIDGERPLNIDTVGSEIIALVGTWQSFKINDGATDEYFYAYVNDATTLTNAYRGYFYNSAQDPVNRLKVSNNDLITLLKTHYIFLDQDLTTVDTTTNIPFVQFNTPSAATGDYWFDMNNSIWKRWNGASFDTVNRTFIGWAVCDSSACLAARSTEFDTRYKVDNTIELEKESVILARGKQPLSRINVLGNELIFDFSKMTWDITSDLAPSTDMYNAIEQSSTMYYFYVADSGNLYISDISPYARHDLMGYYHPHNPWRCVGGAYNDSGSDLGEAYSLGSGLMRKHETLKFKVIGSFDSTEENIDGVKLFSSPAVIRAIKISLFKDGTAGTTTIEVNRASVGPSGVGLVTSDIAAGTGIVAGVRNILTDGLKFLPGDLIYLDINAKATGAEDLTVEIELEQSN